MKKCWQCEKWSVSFNGKKPLLECGFEEFARIEKGLGFVSNECPGFERDVEEKND